MTFPTPVVIADDHPLYRRALCGILKTLPDIGEVYSGSNGKEALDLVRKHKPGLAILDLNMPFMSGLEVIERLKFEQPNTRIMILSMRHDLATVRTAVKLGACSFLPKETEVDEIETAVHAVLHDEFYFPLKLLQRLALDRLKKPKSDLFSDTEWEILEQMALQRTTTQIGEKLQNTGHELTALYKSVVRKAVPVEVFSPYHNTEFSATPPETIT